MLVSEEALLEKYLPFDIPVPYKDWHIYAIKMRDYYDVNNAIGIMSIDKNSLGDVDFIMMSNLKFCMLFSSSEPSYMESFEKLLRVALNISDEESFRFCIDDDTEYIEVGVSDILLFLVKTLIQQKIHDIQRETSQRSSFILRIPRRNLI